MKQTEMCWVFSFNCSLLSISNSRKDLSACAWFMLHVGMDVTASSWAKWQNYGQNKWVRCSLQHGQATPEVLTNTDGTAEPLSCTGRSKRKQNCVTSRFFSFQWGHWARRPCEIWKTHECREHRRLICGCQVSTHRNHEPNLRSRQHHHH